MNYTIAPRIFLLLLLMSGFSVTSWAQSYRIADNSSMSIIGSSNVTDWEAEVKTIRGQVVLNNMNSSDWSAADASWFERIELSFPVADIDADSRRMNSNMHQYLKESSHPEITYVFNEAVTLSGSANPALQATLSGIVTVGGEARPVEHDIEIRRGENGQLIVTGSKALKMTDFDISPPTALLGSVRAEDDIEIVFELFLR